MIWQQYVDFLDGKGLPVPSASPEEVAKWKKEVEDLQAQARKKDGELKVLQAALAAMKQEVDEKEKAVQNLQEEIASKVKGPPTPFW